MTSGATRLLGTVLSQFSGPMFAYTQQLIQDACRSGNRKLPPAAMWHCRYLCHNGRIYACTDAGVHHYNITYRAATHRLLQEVVRTGNDDLKCAALETVGNLAFCAGNRVKFLDTTAFMKRLLLLAENKAGALKQRVRTAAIRALAILGERC